VAEDGGAIGRRMEECARVSMLGGGLRGDFWRSERQRDAGVGETRGADAQRGGGGRASGPDARAAPCSLHTPASNTFLSEQTNH
jgi:hypothetical protein